jgi:O-antigen/teichoic acid export membrane protein
MGFEAATQIAWRGIQVCLGLAAMAMGFTLLEIMLVMLVSSVFKALLGFTLLLGTGVRPSGERLSQARLVRETMPFAGYEVGNAIYMQISVVLLFMLQTPEDTGWFSAALRVIMFMMLVPSAFDAAIYPVFSRMYERSSADMGLAYNKSIKFSLLGAVPAAVLVAIMARELAALFGSNFENTAECLVIVAAMLPLYTLNMLMKTALWSGESQREIARNIWISLGVLVVLSWFLIGRLAFEGAALALVAAEASFLGLNAVAARKTGLPMGGHLWKPVAAGAAMAVTALALHFLGDGRFGTAHIAVLAGLSYVLVILLTGAITRSDRKLVRDALGPRRP